MRKLSTLIAMILIATIGGVYATWTYTGDNQVHTMSTKGVVMTNLETSTVDIGSYQISSTLVQGIIDQNKNTIPDEEYHKAILTYEIESGKAAELSVTFAPSLAASSEVAENGIITYMWFGAPGMTYDCDEDGKPDDIFLVPYGEDNFITIHPIGTDLSGLSEEERKTNFVWTKDEVSGNFVFNFIGENGVNDSFASVFTLNDVVLDTEKEYGDYKKAISAFIRCVVSNKTPENTTIGSEQAQN